MNSKTKVTLTLLVLAITIGSLATVAYLFERPFNPYDGIQYPHGMMEIMKVNWDDATGQIKVFMQNFGQPQAIVEISVDEKLDKEAIIVPSGNIEHNQTCEITLSKTYALMPGEITIEVRATSSSVSHKETFIGFEMLRLYWNESTRKIEALVTDIGSYPDVSFGKVYVNGTVDNAVVVNYFAPSPRGYGQIYKISLSGTYASKPTKMLLEFTANGKSFHLTSPFNTADMQINFLRWDEQTGQIKFLVYIPSAHDLEREKPLTFQEIYVDGIVAKVDSISRAYPETYEITLSKTYSEAPAQLTIRVDTDFGAFGEQPFIHNSMGFYETAMPTIAPWRPTPS